ncbi:mitochondrial 54S ribosomal protein YmL41 [Neocucurbitaria cava]|uniref:Large ribosomal subunit protein uL23m n=1 Tax=Neocucurbitaria cava TaxID=798079 RepID=A0A9W8Y6M7_9PLEO|nr:mitochondrial 54S ribosomal protein YmL41 [Neocucurbitaria cava]
MDAIPITKKLIAFGSKKIYLPKFTVALIRTPGISPYHARFLVPLDFSKYDLRDYLYHAYNVKCFNIRSFVKQMPVRDTSQQPRHWFRPESKKYMTVEMEQPFVWPEVPDLEPWGQKEKKKQDREGITSQGVVYQEEAREAARTLRDQARMLLHRREPLVDQSIEKKKVKGVELSPAEQAKEEQRLARERELESMSRLKLWEEKRTDKIVQGDGASGYTIKA